MPPWRIIFCACVVLRNKEKMVMSGEKMKEPQYQTLLELKDKVGLASLGLMTSQVWHDDPKRLLFVLSRYKFVAKILSGKERVLEVGCGDAFGTRIVAQEVGHVSAVDFDLVFIKDIKERMIERLAFDCQQHDILSGPVSGSFDAAYSIDVIEHIHKKDEDVYMRNIASSLVPQGVFIVGTPTIQSQMYASQYSKEGHVNCKDHKELKELMARYFHNVFVFSMNDEVIHTGFYPMAHYLFAIGVGKRA
jgi:2-polyprenyl-3-methyl-5-hydroxy-6-metoxy-1,4-benzoquinol methylase